jgi:hypothetical protein
MTDLLDHVCQDDMKGKVRLFFPGLLLKATVLKRFELL